jgi:Leucine-rich repeat (LRR) protein
LSSCTLIRELYVAGNKISDVEGLHRLFKLTVLDLSFNRITTTKALGQLVANYNSLLVLNLLGNAIQKNIGDVRLNKRVTSLLPKLVYLNKQPVKAQRAVREIFIDRVAKPGLGKSKKRSSVRKSMNRVAQGQGGSSSNTGHRSSASVAPKSRNWTKK